MRTWWLSTDARLIEACEGNAQFNEHFLLVARAAHYGCRGRMNRNCSSPDWRSYDGAGDGAASEAGSELRNSSGMRSTKAGSMCIFCKQDAK